MSFLQTLFAPNIKKLKQSGDVKGLIRALGYEKDSETRKLAAQALGETDDPAVVEPLMSTLRDKCPEVRAAAAEALCKAGDERAVQALSAALEDEEWKVRRYAAEALGNIGDPGAIQPLQKASRARPSADDFGAVKRTADEALARLQARQSAKPLDRLLGGQWSHPISSQATRTAIRVLTRNCRDISDRALSACLKAIDQLAQDNQPVAAEVLCYATLAANHGKVCRVAAEALKGRTTPELIQILCDALHYDRETNPPVREALRALEILGDASASGALVQFLNDFRTRWSMKAGPGLPRMDMFTLGALLEREKSICLAACSAVASLGGAEAVSALQGVGSDSYWTNYKEIATELPGLIAKARRA